MTNERLRRAIVVEAARLMYSRNQTEYYRAKLKAAKRLCKGWVKPAELPTHAEIRDEIQRMANLFEGPSCLDRLREMGIEALRVMQLLALHRPKIIGSTFTGHIPDSDLEGEVLAAEAAMDRFPEHHMEAHQIRDRTIGFRAHQRLKASPDYETLLLLSECDRNGRVPGARVPYLDDVFDALRELAPTSG